MEYTVFYEPKIYFTFTDEEFLLIDSAIRNSNEHKWRAEPGEFWFGISGWRKHFMEHPELCDPDYKHVDAITTRQLDTVILHSMEPYRDWTKGPEGEKYRILWYRLFKILKDTIDATRELNKDKKPVVL